MESCVQYTCLTLIPSVPIDVGVLQVAMPLLFQGRVDLLEEYLSRSREHQVAFVQLVDELIDSETNIDIIVRSLQL